MQQKKRSQIVKKSFQHGPKIVKNGGLLPKTQIWVTFLRSVGVPGPPVGSLGYFDGQKTPKTAKKQQLGTITYSDDIFTLSQKAPKEAQIIFSTCTDDAFGQCLLVFGEGRAFSSFSRKNVDTHETLAGIAKSHLIQAWRALFWGLGTHFGGFVLLFDDFFEPERKSGKCNGAQARTHLTEIWSVIFSSLFHPLSENVCNTHCYFFCWLILVLFCPSMEVPTKQQRKNNKKC